MRRVRGSQPLPEGGGVVNLDDLRKIAEDTKRLVGEGLWLKDDADLIEGMAGAVLALIDRVEKAEGQLDLMEQTLDLSKMVEDKVKKKLDRAEQALQRVRELHQWNRVDQYDDVLGDWVEEYCQGCHEVWPCATIRALEGDDEN